MRFDGAFTSRSAGHLLLRVAIAFLITAISRFRRITRCCFWNSLASRAYSISDIMPPRVAPTMA